MLEARGRRGCSKWSQRPGSLSERRERVAGLEWLEPTASRASAAALDERGATLQAEAAGPAKAETLGLLLRWLLGRLL